MILERSIPALGVLALALAILGCNAASGEADRAAPERGEGSDERSDERAEAIGELRTLTAASSRVLPSVSGMVRHAQALYIVVHDTNSDESGPRMAAARVDRQASPEYRELTADWQAFGGASHDLEAIAAIPDLPGQYLAAESHNRGLDRRRIFHLQVSGQELPELEARLLGYFELPADVKNIEGMAIVSADGGRTLLGLCERNERKGDSARGRDEERYAFIRWAELDFERRTLTPTSVMRLRAERWPSGKGLRTCSELYLDAERGELWLAATLDDEGERHESMIFRMHFDAAMAETGGEWRLTPWARIPGYKVEAIAAPLLPGWGPTLGSDGDDSAGLIWPVEPAP